MLPPQNEDGELPPGVHIAGWTEIEQRFGTGSAARYGASVFWLREGMLADAAMREFLRTWQIKWNGSVRGILEVA